MEAELAARVKEIEAAGGQAIALGGDMAEEADIVRLFAAVDGALDPVTALINNAGAHGWPYIGPTILNMPDADLRGWLFTGIGALAEGFLMWAQHRWHWWPFHPVGFAISVGWLTSQIWLSALIAWLLKAIILHVGGGKLFQTLKPLFLGLILGNVVAGGVWFAIDGYNNISCLWSVLPQGALPVNG